MHFGHLTIAAKIAALNNVEEVWFLPAKGHGGKGQQLELQKRCDTITSTVAGMADIIKDSVRKKMVVAPPAALDLIGPNV